MPGHADVDERHVGPRLEDEREGLLAVPRLGHDLDAGDRLDEPANAGPHERVVVCKQDPHEHLMIPRGSSRVFCRPFRARVGAPTMSTGEGLTSEPLRAALRDTRSLGAAPPRSRRSSARHGGGPDPRPNLKLAAAFGDEMAGLDVDGRAATRLLRRLGADDAAPDTREVFLPMAAAHGWVGLLQRAARRRDGLGRGALREPQVATSARPCGSRTHAALLAYALACAKAAHRAYDARLFSGWTATRATTARRGNRARSRRGRGPGGAGRPTGRWPSRAAAGRVRFPRPRAIAEAADRAALRRTLDGRRRPSPLLPRTTGDGRGDRGRRRGRHRLARGRVRSRRAASPMSAPPCPRPSCGSRRPTTSSASACASRWSPAPSSPARSVPRPPRRRAAARRPAVRVDRASAPGPR